MSSPLLLLIIPGDLRTRKRTGTSCQIEIHFSIKRTDYLLKYTLLRFQIYVRAIVLITKQDQKISASFIKNNERYNRSHTAKWISIWTTLSARWLASIRVRDHLDGQVLKCCILKYKINIATIPYTHAQIHPNNVLDVVVWYMAYVTTFTVYTLLLQIR